MPWGWPSIRLVRYREVGGRLGERAVLLDGVPASTIHDGGRIRFGPDGLLYLSTGDASTTSLSQDLDSVAGKILRLNRDGTAPRDNPFGSLLYSFCTNNRDGRGSPGASDDRIARLVPAS